VFSVKYILNYCVGEIKTVAVIKTSAAIGVSNKLLIFGVLMIV
jgi:hypothetical protein